ncbi:MAG: bifunctional riboflavin kinase/FAD synthetase [Pseudomonadota bacterium]
MRVFQGYQDLPADARGASVALGNFDGLHAGHRAVIDAATRAGASTGAPLGVVLFDPPPRRFFQPEAPSFRVMTPRARERALRDLGVDLLFVLPFNADIAAMSDAQFAKDVLADGLGVSAVSVGFDFQFGKGRMGDVVSLKAHGERLGFTTEVAERVADGVDKASSSAIRDRIASGDVAAAARMLGGLWTVDAEVEGGEKRGRTIGFPTANLRLGRIIHPAHGVYAVWTRLDGEAHWRPGVANFGRTPTTGERDPLLEVNVFNFDGDLYDRRLHVAFVDFLRAERKFDGLDALKAQIAADAEDARIRLEAGGPPPAPLLDGEA